MDLNVTAMLQVMQDQQKLFMETLPTIAKAETVSQPACLPPKLESFETSKEIWVQYL